MIEWLQEFIRSLPLDQLGDYAQQIVNWWIVVTADIPPEMLPIYAYVGASVLVLILWLFVVRVLPSPFGAISWIMVAAILLTPTVSLGDYPNIAPACIAVVYGVLLKDNTIALNNAMLILAVMTAGMFVGFVWQRLRLAWVEQQAKRRDVARRKVAADSAGIGDMALQQSEGILLKEPKK